MTYLITFLVVTICFVVFAKGQWLWALNRARKKGLFPKKGKATMFDVRELILLGEKDLAIFLYIDIFKVPYQKSKEAVEAIERSIIEKESQHDSS